MARAKALKAPNDCQNLARLVTAFKPQIRNIDAEHPEAEALLDLLDQADFWRRPERFSQLMNVLECALPGESGPLNLLRTASGAATGVDQKLSSPRATKARSWAAQSEPTA